MKTPLTIIREINTTAELVKQVNLLADNLLIQTDHGAPVQLELHQGDQGIFLKITARKVDLTEKDNWRNP